MIFALEFFLLFSCAFAIVKVGREFVCVHHASIWKCLLYWRTWCFDTLYSDAGTDRCIFHGTSCWCFTWITWNYSCTSCTCCSAFASHVCSFFTDGSVFQSTHSHLSAICLRYYTKCSSIVFTVDWSGIRYSNGSCSFCSGCIFQTLRFARCLAVHFCAYIRSTIFYSTSITSVEVADAVC